MLLDTGADMSLITIDILRIHWSTWASDMNISNLDNHFYRTVNSQLPILGEMKFPMTVIHVTQPSILMIKIFLIENHGKSIISMAANALQQFEAIFQLKK